MFRGKNERVDKKYFLRVSSKGGKVISERLSKHILLVIYLPDVKIFSYSFSEKAVNYRPI